MAIVLDHTIVPAKDKDAAARFFAHIFGLEYEGAGRHFAPVRVNDALTLDFADDDEFESHHYAFRVDDAQFDAIFTRLTQDGVVYGSGPYDSKNMTINHRRGGRGLYFADADGHLWEIMTR